MAEQDRLCAVEKKTRKSYTYDKKLKVVSFYKENGSNLYRTCKEFDLKDCSQDEEKITKLS